MKSSYIYASIFTLLLIIVCSQVWFIVNVSKELKAIEALQKPPPETPQTTDPPPQTDTPHHALVEKAEQTAGVNLSVLATLIIKEEAIRTTPYKDTEGAPTIGVGRNLRGNGISVTELDAIAKEVDRGLLLREAHIQNGRIHIETLDVAERVFVKPLTKDDIHLLLVHDLSRTVHEAVGVFGEAVWADISEARRLAILDVLFNLGLSHFRTFVKFISDVKEKHWEAAAAELLLSEAARENILRYHRASLVLRTDDTRYFNP